MQILTLVLAAMSVADLATTRLALASGHREMSPGGAFVLAELGMPGLVVLKALALVLVWTLLRRWPIVGLGVGCGLAVLTAAAVGGNLYVLGGGTVWV